MTPASDPVDREIAAHASRAAGQAAAVAEMIRGHQSFDIVVQQLLATRGSLDSLLVRLVEHELTGFQSPGAAGPADVGRVLRTAFDRTHRMPGQSPLSPRVVRERNTS